MKARITMTFETDLGEPPDWRLDTPEQVAAAVQEQLTSGEEDVDAWIFRNTKCTFVVVPL